MKNKHQYKTCTITRHIPVALILIVLAISGCATSRSVVDVGVKPSANPATGTAVKIVRVTDRRRFEVSPRNASIPSLKGGDINNKDITLRAIARKRNTFGMALGDVLLPEGRTVGQLCAETLTRAFHKAGYRVLKAGEPGYDKAITFEADIEQFWTWVSQGWSPALVFQARLRLKGGLAPFKKGQTFSSHVVYEPTFFTSKDFVTAVNKGLDDLETKVSQLLFQKN